MRRFFTGLAILMAAGALAAMSGFNIHAVAKRVDASAPQNKGDGTRTISKEHWNYEVTVENASFQPAAAAEVRYMIFYKAEELGSKEPAKQEHRSGAFSIDALAPHARKVFTTNTVELRKSHLTGEWYFSGGERIRAEDTLSGIWVRAYQGEQVVGEYANPSVLTKEQWRE